MEWPLVVATFILGLVLGYVARTIIARNGETQGRGKALEQTKLEMSQHKQEVMDHFEVHYKQLNELSDHINKLNKQWNDATSTLAPKSHLKPLPSISSTTVTVKEEASK